MRTEYLGGLPTFKSGSNAGRLDRVKASQKLGMTFEELSKAYNNWIQIFRKPGSTLTFKQYLTKMRQAGIRPYDLGMKTDQYQLSRKNDDGPYRNDNCRFLKAQENRAEQKVVTPYEHVVRKYGEERARQMMSENGIRGQANLLHQRTRSSIGRARSF